MEMMPMQSLERNSVPLFAQPRWETLLLPASPTVSHRSGLAHDANYIDET